MIMSDQEKKRPIMSDSGETMFSSGISVVCEPVEGEQIQSIVNFLA